MASDLHGDMQDAESVVAILAFIKDFKPEVRVFAGDLFDFRNLRKGASDEDKAASLEDDWDAGIDFAQKFFAGASEAHMLLGNHDWRLWNLRDNCVGLVRDYAIDRIKQFEAHAKRWRAKVLPYDSALGVLQLGSLAVIHGYHTGLGAAREHARAYQNCVFGHTHTIESTAISSLKPAEARGIGCLCKRDMEYANAKTGKLRWGQGWGYGLLFEDGSYVLNQARKINGVFHCATQFKSY